MLGVRAGLLPEPECARPAAQSFGAMVSPKEPAAATTAAAALDLRARPPNLGDPPPVGPRLCSIPYSARC